MSIFLQEIKREIAVRLDNAKRELERLLSSETRIKELKALIAEAEKELKDFESRLAALVPQAQAETASPTEGEKAHDAN